MGYDAISLTGWQAGIYCNNVNQNAIIESIDTTRINNELAKRKIVIVAGFQGYNDNLDITTLGRGGSDTTAVALAASLGAKYCYIFSDVDGVYTSDPNKLPSAQKLETLSYEEMLDIANEGAKVLHNRCVEIGKKFNIPIITKSTFNNKSGTIIENTIEENSVKSIVKNDDLILVNLKYDSYSFKLFNQVYDLLISNNIIPMYLTNNSVSCFDVNFIITTNALNKLEKIVQDNINMFTLSIKNISKISVVGSGVENDTQTIGKIMYIIKNFDYDIYKINVTNTKITLTFKEKVPNKLLELLHNELF